jgi:NADPH-dependent glutamate synthase beta subunit-like oxidoreductase/formate hydrogenlyase subunit 6/NADH:ubiquinone oxidoreductase subunit I
MEESMTGGAGARGKESGMANEKVLALANKMGRKKAGAKDAYTFNDPEYLILEPVVTTEMAEVGLGLEFRVPKSAAEIAAERGVPAPEAERRLWELSLAGVCFVNEIDGVDRYWTDLWIPGTMEMMVNNKENVRKHPQIARAFEAYGRVRGPATSGNFPVGMGLMRVIPIEKAIMGETRRASYEEVSKYLDENTVFTVSDCSCRTAREAMGEGCGHLKEDMCIQMGHAAEYYIRTGRGRQISREEAYEIIRRAEENGLMHQVPNTDGPGKTHAICNCCGCSCLSLRTAEMFLNNDMVRSNYVSKVDREKCVACGECVEACPVGALKLGQRICAESGDPLADRSRVRVTPRDNEWGPDKWNPDYRTNRVVVTESGTSPCKAECPAHIGVQGYIKLAAQGKYEEALELIKRENPLPAVCGRICPRRCESACARGGVDDPVAIDEIKKFVAELDLDPKRRYVPKIAHDYGKKIAVIGSGPAGLSCAYYLAREGYKVTVFEKQKKLGGMLSLGIPSFRLEKSVVEAEIDVLRAMGVEFSAGVEVGADLSLAQLRERGYAAFYLAVGAQAGRVLGIEGEESAGARSGVDFLRAVNLGEGAALEGRTVVIGGGNVAIDVARTAVRVGSAEVEMFCLESRAEMPALPEEIDEALEEGIGIENSWGPSRFIVKDGRVAGVEFKKCVSVFDENRRFSPKFDESVTRIVEAEDVLVSIGQAMDWGGLLAGSRVELNRNGTAKADALTFQTGEPDVFAGGDAVSGPKFAIDAIAQGKEAAISIHRFVQPGQSLVIGRIKRDYRALDKDGLDLDSYDRLPRQRAARRADAAGAATADAAAAASTAAAGLGFRDARATFTEEQVRAETERCLGCGATVTDEYVCVGCGACTLKCKFDAISLVRKYDSENVEFRKLKPIVAKRMISRKLIIAAKKPFRALSPKPAARGR